MKAKTIDSAPRDGREILAYGILAGEISGIADEAGWAVVCFTGKGDYDGYEWSVTASDAYASWMKPTHWVKLPDDPIDKKEA